VGASEHLPANKYTLEDIAQLVPIINSQRQRCPTIKKKKESKKKTWEGRWGTGAPICSELLPRCMCTRGFSPIGGKSVLGALSWDADNGMRAFWRTRLL